MSTILTLRAAARELGVHPSTLRRWIDDGEGPVALIKQGPRRATVRIRRADLDAWRRRHSRGEVVESSPTATRGVA